MRKRKKEAYLVYDREMRRTKAYVPEELPLNQEAVKERSIFFFDDPAPCFLRANAVRLRMLEELCAELRKESGAVAVDVLPDQIRRYLKLGEDACFLEYCCEKDL